MPADWPVLEHHYTKSSAFSNLSMAVKVAVCELSGHPNSLHHAATMLEISRSGMLLVARTGIVLFLTVSREHIHRDIVQDKNDDCPSWTEFLVLI